MGCSKRTEQLFNTKRALSKMMGRGLLAGNPAYEKMMGLNTQLRKSVAAITPRITIPVSKLKISPWMILKRLLRVVGSPERTLEELSEAEIRVWFDNETGWMSEARLYPFSRPVYHPLTEDEALDLVSEDPSPHLVASLFESVEDKIAQ